MGAQCALHYVQKRLLNFSLSSVCCRSQNSSYRISVMAGCLNSGYSTNSCYSAGVVFPLDLRCDRGRLLRRRRCQLQEIPPVCSQAAGELRHMDGRVSDFHAHWLLLMWLLSDSLESANVLFWCVSIFSLGFQFPSETLSDFISQME